MHAVIKSPTVAQPRTGLDRGQLVTCLTILLSLITPSIYNFSSHFLPSFFPTCPEKQDPGQLSHLHRTIVLLGAQVFFSPVLTLCSG